LKQFLDGSKIIRSIEKNSNFKGVESIELKIYLMKIIVRTNDFMDDLAREAKNSSDPKCLALIKRLKAGIEERYKEDIETSG